MSRLEAMHTLSLMQPYFFPYLGYFDLLAFSETFVFYDDSAFSKNSWFNRNRILGEKEGWEYVRTSVRKASLGTPVNEIQLANKDNDFATMLRQLKRYNAAPYHDAVVALVTQAFERSDNTLASIAVESVALCADYMGLDCIIKRSSAIDYDRTSDPVSKVLEICETIGAGCYLNLSGGRELYSNDTFDARGIALRFCRSEPVEYVQNERQFVPYLSVIDAMMWVSAADLNAKFRQREPKS